MAAGDGGVGVQAFGSRVRHGAAGGKSACRDTIPDTAAVPDTAEEKINKIQSTSERKHL